VNGPKLKVQALISAAFPSFKDADSTATAAVTQTRARIQKQLAILNWNLFFLERNIILN
jgi:hypothetical protein